MSQRETAEAAGISPTYVRTLEAGSNPNTKRPSRPSPTKLRAIGGALNVDPSVLLELAGYELEPVNNATIEAPALNSVEGDLRRIRDAAKKLYHRSPFIFTQTVESIRKFTTEFLAMADGTFRCTAEEEPFLTRMAYRQAKSTVRAVSYQDEKWWNSSRGQEYLDLQEEMHNRRIEIIRIFLVPEAQQPFLRETFERHVALGIPTYVMSPQDVGNDLLCRDFVIFDENLLRTGELADAQLKKAEFTDNPAAIAQAVGDFRVLQRIAENTPTEVDRILDRWTKSKASDSSMDAAVAR